MKRMINFLIIAAVLVGMAFAFLYIGNLTRPILNLNDYVVVTAEGTDGDGTVSAKVDYHKMVFDLWDYHPQSALDKYVVYIIAPETNVIMQLEELNPFELVCDTTEDVSNGDVIEITWKINEEGMREFRKMWKQSFNIQYNDFTYRIDGLETSNVMADKVS